MSNERDRMLDMITEMSNKNAEKDQRIAELEKELSKHKKLIEELECESVEELANLYEKLQLEWFRNAKELTELKANAIVPKFKIGDEIWAVVSYITESEDDIYNNVIETGIVQKIEIDKRELKYWCDKGRIYWEDKFVKLFATKEEAQQKLKELEGK